MDTKNTAFYTVMGLAFVTLGLTLFDDNRIIQYGFMGAGIMMLLFSALRAFRSTDEE